LNSIFLDGLAVDLERLQRINRTVSLIPEDRRIEAGVHLRPARRGAGISGRGSMNLD
jgi:NTE family protein